MTQEENNQDARLTSDLTSMGTPIYMPPEQTDAAKVTSAADRYAFGMMTYEMLSSHQPWREGAGAGEILGIKFSNQLKPLHEKIDIDLGVSKAVMKMVSADPSARFESQCGIP